MTGVGQGKTKNSTSNRCLLLAHFHTCRQNFNSAKRSTRLFAMNVIKIW